MFHSYFFALVLLFFLPLGWVIFPLSVDLGGPPQCLNFGPSLEPGVNRGLGSLFWGYGSDLFYFPFPFSLCFRPVSLHSPQGYALPRAVSFLGHSSAFYHTGIPSLCWPLASSGSSGIPTWFSRPRTLAFLRLEPLQVRAGNIYGKSYVWQNLILNSSWGGGPFGNYTRRGSCWTFLQAL